MKYQNLAIHCQNQAEKLSAVLFLWDKLGKQPQGTVYRDTLRGDCIASHPFVFVDGSGNVDAMAASNGKTVIPFADMCRIDEYDRVVKIVLNNELTAEISLSSRPYVKVGCQQIPIHKVKEVLEAYDNLR